MTTQYLLCTECRKKYPTHQKLFDTLYDFQRNPPSDCPSCAGKRELHLELDFQLGAGDSEFKVISAFLPEKSESWLGEEEEEVTFYPFLVTLQRGDGSRFCWLPYWHVTGKEARYGQHAICLDQGQFENLVQQAKEAQQTELALA
jgi:hypothetical protein